MRFAARITQWPTFTMYALAHGTQSNRNTQDGLVRFSGPEVFNFENKSKLMTSRTQKNMRLFWVTFTPKVALLIKVPVGRCMMCTSET